ncbi:MAG: tyrosine-type recombinase/integrase [Anaerolineae bacterium]
MARGSVTKRGDSWRIAVELPPDPATGKRRQRWETFVGTKKDADRRLRELLTLADAQRLGVTPKMPLSEYLAIWLRDHGASRSPKTADNYRAMVRCYIVPYLGRIPLAKLTPAQIAAWQTQLRKAPRADGKTGGLSASTIHCAWRVLRAALNMAAKWRLMPVSPMDDCEPPRLPRREMKVFDVSQAQAFLTACAEEGIKWQAWFTCALHTGARPGELRALTWPDVDFVPAPFTYSAVRSTFAAKGSSPGLRRPVPAGGRSPWGPTSSLSCAGTALPRMRSG